MYQASYKWVCTLFSIWTWSAVSFGQSPHWTAPQSNQYSYTATMIAALQFDGIPSNSIEDSVAVFVNNEIRGLGRAIDVGNGQFLHFITLYSNVGTEPMRIKVYHKSTNQVYDVAGQLIFKVQQSFGSITNPYIIRFYTDNNAPLTLLSVPPQTTMATVPFQAIDMSNYLIQPDTFPITWSIIYNANLQAFFDGNILYIAGVNGFVGQTTLTIKAIESTISLIEDRGSASRSLPSTQIAETNILCTVTPLLAAPHWQPAIPSQGIVKGNTFANTLLGDFENQYNGTAIIYDYRPIILPNNPSLPAPNWGVNEQFGTTMSIVAKIEYTPKYIFNHASDILVATINNSIRGVATQDSATGLYFLSIGGEASVGDTIHMQFYSGAMKQILDVRNNFTYTPFNIIGNVENPYVINFAPIQPIIPTGIIPGGNATMAMSILDTTFTGSVIYEFIAYDAFYPDILHDTTRASYCIVNNVNEFVTMYQDADGDGFGNPNVSIQICEDAEGYVSNDNDCDDTNPEDPTTTIALTESSGFQANDGHICIDDKVILTASGAQSYQWDNGSTSASTSVYPHATSTYHVTVTHASGCQGIKSITINVEGRKVINTANDGIGTLRNVYRCLAEGDTITYDQPFINTTTLTASFSINKNATIINQGTLRPSINIDYNASNEGFLIDATKILTLHNVDIRLINAMGKKAFEGNGTISITGTTYIRQ